ncbi:hypothetical protein DICPUDRAFT_82723 [Dictyostelium purpureum]|uniref:RRM domain-containing protein n=1 Tax=Dictyostelium purpureum TaxID=5786 RepID=F0ZXD8_DICPU|nr:uncharacterized protein DICPUDRAFT_82723 [Dictyostelium purpureum]EGC31389.1 hypothetical protein DICPUDRAFT_82723 [Dictyostelium purpureum]|eukprot:XP_003292087.1 hypothetical protein DICPUDRAFT_82723 [Dictyostelium purpureum]
MLKIRDNSNELSDSLEQDKKEDQNNNYSNNDTIEDNDQDNSEINNSIDNYNIENSNIENETLVSESDNIIQNIQLDSEKDIKEKNNESDNQNLTTEEVNKDTSNESDDNNSNNNNNGNTNTNDNNGNQLNKIQEQEQNEDSKNDSLPNKRSLEQQEDFEESISKKQKNLVHTPSKVVHLRNLPPDCTEQEIISLIEPFGAIENMIIIKGKSQALVQMVEISSAISFIQYYTTVQGSIRSKTIYTQFSNRKEISPAKETPNCILLITINNYLYNVTIEELYKVFSNFGTVNKVLLFTKSGNYQSLIEMKTPEEAVKAKNNLDGMNINNTCSLKIQFSSLTSLKIKYNNEKSRDFTVIDHNYQLQIQQQQQHQQQYQQAAGYTLDPLQQQQQHQPQPQSQQNTLTPPGLLNPPIPGSSPPMLIPTSPTVQAQISPYIVPLDVPYNQNQSYYSNNTNNNGYYNYNGTNNHDLQLQQPQMQSLNLQQQQNMAINIQQQQQQQQQQQYQPLLQIPANTAHHQYLIQPQNSQNSQNSQLQQRLQPSQNSNVLIVAGLPMDNVSPDDLFTLFGIYGDPIRVKILFNRKDTALIQMNTSQQAELVLQYLHSFPFKGHNIRVNISKHKVVQLPRPGEDNGELTKDYTGSPMHRFKLPGSKNYLNIHPPSNFLHLSNLPDSNNNLDLENRIRQLFSVHGEVKSFKFFQNDMKMALLEMASLEQAINSLVSLHGYTLMGDTAIKVSFAKPTTRKTPFFS